MPPPSLSIGLPVFNGDRLLRRALDSLLAQDLGDFEVVISDNASTDGTAEICREYAQRDSRIRYFRNEANIGVNPNHDRVFQLSQGEYFTWMADDVEYQPGMLRRCMEVITNAPRTVVLAYPLCALISDDRTAYREEQNSIECRHPWALKRLEKVVHYIVKVNQLYGIMRSDALRKTRLNGPFASSDYVLLAELAMLGQIWEIPEVLITRQIEPTRGTAAVFGNAAAWQKWLDPNHRTSRTIRWIPIRERLALEYFRSAWHVPMGFYDKVSCLFVAPWLPYWRVLLRVSGPWRTRLGMTAKPRSPRRNETRTSDRQPPPVR